jgi:anti-sigma regulatory factor (Ser/Thr protein kinase)
VRRPAQTAKGERTMVLVLPATHAAARIARRTVTDFARLDGLPSHEVEQLALVVSELLGNAVDHGGGAAAMDEEQLVGDVQMSLEFHVSASRWTLAVSDQGGGRAQDLQGYLVPGADIPLEDERGRGFFLLRQMVDALSIEGSADGLGLTVSVVRHHTAH